MKSSNIKFGALLMLFTALVSAVKGQAILDEYIRSGLENNLVLQQKNVSLKQAEQSLQIARSYFVPSVTLLGDYTSGHGGRSIQLPIGDLLNPVYASLNQLTQSDEFPQVQNVEQNFFPKNFYDARLRTSVPIINTDLYVNQKIQNQQVVLKEYEVDIYRRQLVRDLKTSYYNYLSSLAAVKIYESAVDLVGRNHEINQSLLKNGKSLPANVLRSASELERVKAELNSARAAVTNSQKYFNFLLNRDLDSDIKMDTNLVIDESLSDDTTESNREELRMLQTVKEIQETQAKLYRLSRLPKINAFVDFGSQASDWKVNDDSRYYLAGVQLSLPIFQGFRNNTQLRQAQLGVQRSQYDLQNTQAQLQVAVDIARNNFETTKQNYVAATDQLKSAKSYFNLVEKGYQQGVNSQIEYLDARNQLTSSELQLNLRQYEVLTAAAQLERETSSFNLPK